MPETASKCLDEIDESLKREHLWRKNAKDVIRQYKPTREYGGSSFNILAANTAVLGAALFSNNPRPQIRLRWGKPKTVQKSVSAVLERCVEYFLDGGLGRSEFSEIISDQIGVDLLLTGRMVTRVRYEPMEGNDQNIAYAEVIVEAVDWEDFCTSDGRRWREVTWIAFRHWFTDQEMEDKFGKEGKPSGKMANTDTQYEESRKAYQEHRSEVWELWDLSDRKVKWIDSNDRDEYLLVADDPLRIPGFWPIPRPILSIRTDTLEPIPEYLLYQDLAEELDIVTKRINNIASAISVRGVCDATIVEFERLFDAADNDVLPAENISQIRDYGGLDKAIWFLPIDMLQSVLTSLSMYREALKFLIYEITGLSDITRGATDASETAAAQQLKARYSNLRVSPRQQQLAAYSREVIRIMSHIIAEHFEPPVLQAITGIELPSEEYEGVTWEEVLSVMRNELALSFVIDIETDSTIADMLLVEKAEIKDLLGSVTSYITSISPLVAEGMLPLQAAKDLLLSAVRKFRFGSEVEEAIEQMGQRNEA